MTDPVNSHKGNARQGKRHMSNLIKKVRKGLDMLQEELDKERENSPNDSKSFTLEEFLAQTDEFLFGQANAFAKKNQTQYSGGILLMTLDADKAIAGIISVRADLYFCDINGEWIVDKSNKRYLRPSQFTDWEENPYLMELREKKVVEFHITPPEPNTPPGEH